MDKLPRFKRGDSQRHYSKFPKSEREAIDGFIKYVSITSKSNRRLSNNKLSLITFRKFVNKPFEKVTLEDLRDFLALLNNSDRTESSRNELKHTIKRFLKWKFKNWSERFNSLEDIKLKMGMNEEKINSETLLKKKDVDDIMNEEKSLFWKTFFITLYESGLRPIELRTLLWKKIDFDVDDDISEIHIFATKTHKARSVFVKEGTYWLKRLKEESDSDLVFPSVRDKTKPLGKELPAVWLKRISEKVLGRPVYPYILRHSRANELYKSAEISDKTAQKFLGHKKSMSDIYSHLSSDDVKEAMAKTIYKKKQVLTKKKEKELEDKIKTFEDEQKIFKKIIKKLYEQVGDVMLTKEESKIFEK